MQLVGKVGGIEEELRGEGIWVDLTKTYMYVWSHQAINKIISNVDDSRTEFVE